MKYKEWDLDQDYPILEKWFKEHQWDSVIPKEMLPSLGVMIVEEKKEICAAGLYIDKNAKFGFMYGIFSNPNTGKIKLFKAMKMCLQEIKKQAIKNKLGMVYTITGDKALEKLYIQHGDMEYAEKNVKSYVMNLDKKKYDNLDWIK